MLKSLDRKRVKLGIAPIGWTNDDMPELGAENSFQQCLSEMALAGFAGSEVGAAYPKDAQTLKWHLDLRKLVICNQWFNARILARGIAEVEREFRHALEFLKILGSDIIGPSEQTYSCQSNQSLGLRAGKPEFSVEEWNQMTSGFNRLGRIAVNEGFKLCFHHHMGTGVQTSAETERFLNDTNPDTVFLTFDTGHFSYSGADPVQQLERMISRVGHVHLKDVRLEVLKKALESDWPFMRAVREGVFTVPGDGGEDNFPAVFEILARSKYEGWLVVEAEQDPARANPFEYALKARQYIRDHTGL